MTLMARPKILVDSGFLYSLFSADEPHHEGVADAVESYDATLIVPYVALTEAAYLFNRDGGVRGVIQFLDALANASLQYEVVNKGDLTRARQITAEFIGARLDFVDCCLMALSERLDVTQVFTLDQRDFSIFRPKHCAFLELLP